MALLTGAVSRAAALTLAVLAATAGARAAQRTATAEDDIKAAFLLNFTRFVQWPAAPPGDRFQICTVAEPAFEAAVTHTISGESTDGRLLLRASPDTPEAARACQILFLSRMENARLDRWLAAVRGLPVLVVAESKKAADAGAEITFVVEDNRVKFDVNDDAAARAGLTISSKLLRVARHVTPKDGR
jgi:hypothetical protein